MIPSSRQTIYQELVERVQQFPEYYGEIAQLFPFVEDTSSPIPSLSDIYRYTFISRLDKTGWFRGSVQDAGWIANFYKPFNDLGITVILEQQGSISVGYYDDNAELGDLSFVKDKSVSFGNYTYNAPSQATDPRLIALEHVPSIVYSEIMAEMQWWKENSVKE
jgi:hypothetical protein